MGMGVCCVKQHNQDKGEFNNKDDNIDLNSNENPNKERVIVPQEEMKVEAKPQREEVEYEEVVERAARKKSESAPEEPTIEPQSIPLQMVSENSKVRELEEKLGPFKPPEPPKDSVKRETRATVILDNGARYTGQW
eukprot:TRINITY_DN1563_c0_g10_i1.p3 TRINITY_DN1563_c0_g10~~TRINITY_DN1563_c0_g10_i1.p3  ORF type:complete len:136 (-),score=47.32 TRINITY_DN1563_c0_g10_i1:804-1211(-)